MSERCRASWNLAAATLAGFWGLWLQACSESSPFVTDLDGYVIQAFLYAGEPVTDVSVTGLLPIGADSSEVGDPILDATITLVRRGYRYDLTATPGEARRYSYPGDDLEVVVGDTFRIEIVANGRTARAQTVVPEPPHGVQLSADSMIAPDVSSGPGGFGGFEGLVVRWSNPTDDLHFIVIDNVESDPEILPTAEIFTRFAPRFIVPPTPGDSSVVTVRSLTHYGRHRLKVYSVNGEYVDLYEGLLQDSRDLNEPPSNIDGVLGIFSAFSADSAFFDVR